jgi:hypothetical protein
MDDDRKVQEAKEIETIEALLPDWKSHVGYIREQIEAFGGRGFESIKHLSALSAGSVVLIATFMTDIFPRDMIPVTKGLIAVSFLSFGLALVSSMLYMNAYFNALLHNASTATLDPDDPRSQNPKLASLVVELKRHNEDTRTLTKTVRLLKSAHFWTSVCFTLGILTFGTAILSNLFFG